MLVEKLKQVVNDLGWHFNNGSGHWQNLQDLPDDTALPFEAKQIYFLLLWNDQVFTVSQYNAIESEQYEGEFILCVRSNIQDPDYNSKYDQHIAKLRQEQKKVIRGFTNCEDFTIKNWRNSEVENIYDTNLDGIKVRFTIGYESD